MAKAENPPTVLAERYEIDSLLGEGGMAKVFRGTDRVLGRSVAVKVLAPQFARDDTSVARFRREAQSAASLNHPNVVSVFDTGSEDGFHWIVMELIDGHTLKEALEGSGSLPPERAVEVGRAVAVALAAAHEKGLVHRDVKPANIMLTPGGETKVMDFGIARAVTSSGDPTLTRTGFVMGTAAYISPEQAQGKPVDARSDIYSLGCVIYEMLAGRPPFVADSPVALATKHMAEEPEPLTRLNPSVPPELEAMVSRAMRKEPAERYQDAREMAADLGRAITGELPLAAAGAATEPIGPRGGDTGILPAALPEPVRESFRRSPWLPAALIGALLALLAVVAVIVLLSDRTGEPRREFSAPPTRSESPSPSPSPTPPSVSDAFAAFAALVNDGYAADEITDDAAVELLDDARQAIDAYQADDLENAMEDLQELRETIDGFVGDEQITSGDRAEALHEAVDDLERAMAASPPEGQGKGKGKGKGHDGDEGDD